MAIMKTDQSSARLSFAFYLLLFATAQLFLLLYDHLLRSYYAFREEDLRGCLLYCVIRENTALYFLQYTVGKIKLLYEYCPDRIRTRHLQYARLATTSQLSLWFEESGPFHAHPIHAYRFMPTYSCPFFSCQVLFMPDPFHAYQDLFMPEPIHAQTDSCHENPKTNTYGLFMPRHGQDLFMPKLIHASKSLFMPGFFMPMLIHASTALNHKVEFDQVPELS